MSLSSPRMPLSSPSLSTLTTAKGSYKGKYTRSWQQLPPEIIRLIATYYLLDAAATNYCPIVWETRDAWPGRLVYVIMRDGAELERLMCICPSWHTALENHLYWQQACAVIDPNDVFAQNAIIRTTPAASAGSNAPTTISRISYFRHFRNLLGCSCVVCRINHPYSNQGLAAAKRTVHTPYLGLINTCKDHRKNTFCGACLKESPHHEQDPEYHAVCIVENEDEETWPGVEATCRYCRQEWLWKRCDRTVMDREAIGGPRFKVDDWEVRQSIEAFIELGEGTVTDVIVLAREKNWLRKCTKLPELLSQALAASRFSTRAEAGDATYGTGEEELSDEEEDAELLSLTEDAGGVRDISILDWARNRILDGHWISPADMWYGHYIPGKPWIVPARHPCPWNRGATYSGALEDGETAAEANGEELEHPRPKTVKMEVPPSYQLCEQTYRAFQKTMRDILLPAMTNIVRRIVIESSADGVDPTMRASKMTLEDVAEELRDEAVWFNGIDWLERRANKAREDQEKEHSRARNVSEEDDSSSSSRSDGSHTTSPVLSTTTLQTTPSPPPSGDTSSKDDESISVGSPMAVSVPVIPIPVSPVLKSPQLLHPIPYIPVTVSHLPFYSAEAFKMVSSCLFIRMNYH
ncbi:hypothetical protein C8Q75DRAFT_315072 [Abortiporus biennis]|nr:hypothetical protein C8Q75DRAFT_315072 [Abortiporus biennis]